MILSSYPIIEALKSLIIPCGEVRHKTMSAGEKWSSDEYSPISDELLNSHIQGKINLLCALVDATGKVKAACIDIDGTASNLQQTYQIAYQIKQKALEYSIKLNLEFSGRRGWHVWLFSTIPTTTELLLNTLKAIAHLADYQPQEIFPKLGSDGSEKLMIKLPFTQHLKTGGRYSGFIGEEVTWDEQYPILPSPETIIPQLHRNEPITLKNFLDSQSPISSEASSNSHQGDLSSFSAQSLPPCITHWINNGGPEDIEYNKINLVVARAAIALQLSDTQAETIAQQIAQNSSNHPTSKTTSKAKIDNFKSALKSARQGKYQWDCAYVWSGLELKKDQDKIRDRGCILEACPTYHSKIKTASLHSADIFEAIVLLIQQGQKITPGTLETALLEKLRIKN